MSVPSRNDRDLATPTPASNPATAPLPKRLGRSAGRIMVCVSPDRYAPAELIAGASLAQEIGAVCYMVTVVPRTHRRVTWFNAVDPKAMALNTALAETLGVSIVRVVAQDPADGVIAFANREAVTHVIMGRRRRTTAVLSPGSMAQRLSCGLRGIEVRLVPGVDPAYARPVENQWIKLDTIAQAILVGIVLVLAAIAIAYIPWPLVFVVAVIVAVTWCRRLETRRES